MAIQRINFTSSTNLLDTVRKGETPVVEPKKAVNDLPADYVEISTHKKNRNLAFGLGTVLFLIGSFFLGRRGTFGKSIQKFFGGLKEPTSNIPNVINETRLLPCRSASSTVEFVNVEEVDPRYINPRKLGLRAPVEDAEFVEL